MLRDVIETHFWRGSRLALRLVPSLSASEPARRTFALHLAAVLPAALSEMSREIAIYYRSLGQAMSIREPNAVTPPPLLQLHEPKLEDGVLTDLEAQLKSEFGSDVPGQPKSFESAMSLWATELLALSQNIERVRASNTIEVPLEAILVDCVHMMMNRLGVSLVTERWVYQTIAWLILDVCRYKNGAESDDAT